LAHAIGWLAPCVLFPHKEQTNPASFRGFHAPAMGIAPMGCAPSVIEPRIAGRIKGVNSPGLNELLKTLELEWVDPQSSSNGASGTSGENKEPGLGGKLKLRDGVALAKSVLVIIAWDDVLCPSDWLQTDWDAILVGESLEKMAEESDSLLSEISAAVLELLTLATALAEVKVFADHIWPWVQSSNAQSLRILESTLSLAEVTHSPRLLTEEDRSRDPSHLPVLAHYRAMRRSVRARKKEAGSVWSGIVCIGGASALHTAVQKCAEQLSQSGLGAEYSIKSIKSIKLIERSSLAEQLGQLRLLCLWLPKILALDESVHIGFEGDLEHLAALHERFGPDGAAAARAPWPAAEAPESPSTPLGGLCGEGRGASQATGRSRELGIHLLFGWRSRSARSSAPKTDAGLRPSDGAGTCTPCGSSPILNPAHGHRSGFQHHSDVEARSLIRHLPRVPRLRAPGRRGSPEV